MSKNYRIEEGEKIYMSVGESFDDLSKKVVIEVLEELEFYIANNDGEFNEKAYNEVVENIVYDLNPVNAKESRTSVEEYTKEYMNKNYPFNIKK